MSLTSKWSLAAGGHALGGAGFLPGADAIRKGNRQQDADNG